MKRPERKHTRLKEYDYSTPGCYFVTVCTKNRANVLGKVVVGPDALIEPTVQLSEIGKTAKNAIESAEIAYPHIKIISTIMPNHIHLMIQIGEEDGRMRASGPTMGMVVRSIKTLVTRRFGQSIWQERSYDHIVRNEKDYLRILKYMEENPAKWAEDEYFVP